MRTRLFHRPAWSKVVRALFDRFRSQDDFDILLFVLRNRHGLAERQRIRRFGRDRVRPGVERHRYAYGARSERLAVELNLRSLRSRATVDDQLGNAGLQARHGAIDLGLEVVTNRVGVRERELIAAERSHQATELLFASSDVEAHLRCHAHLADVAKRLERGGVVAGLLQLYRALEIRARLGELFLVLSERGLRRHCDRKHRHAQGRPTQTGGHCVAAGHSRVIHARHSLP